MMVMSLRKKVPFKPTTEPAAAMSNCDVPARCVVNWPGAAPAIAIEIRKKHKLRFMRFILLALLAVPLQANEIVVRAARILDGRGHELRQAAVVVDGSKI